MKATKKQLATKVNQLNQDLAIKLLGDFNQPERVLALATELDLTIEEAINELTEQSDEMIEYGSQEYYVLTDEEANQKNEESIENYIEECIIHEMPKHMQNYFDYEAFKRDARMDGRGHNLAGYDGNENYQDINDTTYYIYRWN